MGTYDISSFSGQITSRASTNGSATGFASPETVKASPVLNISDFGSRRPGFVAPKLTVILPVEPTPEELAEKAAIVQARAKQDKIYETHGPMAEEIARLYIRKHKIVGDQREDLRHTALRGLFEANRDFDPKKHGPSFEDFAVERIEAAVIESVGSTGISDSNSRLEPNAERYGMQPNWKGALLGALTS